MRCDGVEAEVRLRAQRDDEGDAQDNETARQADAQVVSMRLLLGENGVGEEEQDVEGERGDGHVVGDE